MFHIIKHAYLGGSDVSQQEGIWPAYATLCIGSPSPQSKAKTSHMDYLPGHRGKVLIFCDSFNSEFLHNFWLCMFRHTYILTVNKRSFLLSTNKIAPNFLTPCILSLGDGPPSHCQCFLFTPRPISTIFTSSCSVHTGVFSSAHMRGTELRWAVGSHQQQDYRKLGWECIFPSTAPPLTLWPPCSSEV